MADDRGHVRLWLVLLTSVRIKLAARLFHRSRSPLAAPTQHVTISMRGTPGFPGSQIGVKLLRLIYLTLFSSTMSLPWPTL